MKLQKIKAYESEWKRNILILILTYETGGFCLDNEHMKWLSWELLSVSFHLYLNIICCN